MNTTTETAPATAAPAIPLAVNARRGLPALRHALPRVLPPTAGGAVPVAAFTSNI